MASILTGSAEIRLIAYYAFLMASCAYAACRGGPPERIVAVVFLAATGLTDFEVSALPVRFRHLETGLLMVDLITFCVLYLLCLRSTRFWPLWVSGLMLIELFTHAFRAIAPDLLPDVYWDAVALWSYPMLGFLGIGTWRHQRRLSCFGSDDAWSYRGAN